MLGLKRGTVVLSPHREEWRKTAKETAEVLKKVLGDKVCGIEHVGSTSIHGISAKPIIDIAVGVKNKNEIMQFADILGDCGIIFRKQDERELLFVMGNLEEDFITHHIHVIDYDGTEWKNYILFRDYLSRFTEKAKEYETLKKELAVIFSCDRENYTKGKSEFIQNILKEAGK